MATFTEDFTRMRQDCDNSRAERRQLVQDNCEHVKSMLAGFCHHHAEMASQLRTELKDFATDLKAGGSVFRNESNPRKHR